MEKGDVDKLVCPECELARLRKRNIPKVATTRSDRVLYRLHIDLSGRKLSTLEGERYWLLIVDDYSRYKWVYFQKSKTKEETFQNIKNHIEMLERECAPNLVSRVRSDGGGEFVNVLTEQYYREKGVISEGSTPYSQFQNGVAERSIGVIGDVSRTMMMVAGSPTYDWKYAVAQAVYCRNRTSSNSIEGRVPFELFHGYQRTGANDMDVPTFGCLVYAKVMVRGKADPKSKRCVFLQNSEHMKGLVVRDVSSPSQKLREYVTRDVKIDDSVFPYQSRMVPRPAVPPLDPEDIKEINQVQKAQRQAQDRQDVKVVDAEVREDGSHAWQVEKIVGRRVSRFGRKDLTASEKGYDYKVVWSPLGMWPDSWEPEKNLVDCQEKIQEFQEVQGLQVEENESPPVRRSQRLNATAVVQGKAYSLFPDDPKTRKQALDCPRRSEWLSAEREELQSIAERQVWELVPRQPGMNVLGCRFVYKTKRAPDGSIRRYKVRLVAQGFGQKEGVDFRDIFATTVAFQAVRTVLWVAVYYRFYMCKIDIKTFFLYGRLKETIYMAQPPGYANDPSKVCKLSRAIYGLKQAMRVAYEELCEKLKSLKFKRLKTDQNVHFRRVGKDVVILCIWVDDILCFTSSRELGEMFKTDLLKFFEIDAQDNPTDFLQMQLLRDRVGRRLIFHQADYCRCLLKKFQLEDCLSKKVPFTTMDVVPPRAVEIQDDLPYMELVGSLIWMLKSRPDIAFHVSFLARYMNRYNEAVYDYAKRVLKYLKGTI